VSEAAFLALARREIDRLMVVYRAAVTAVQQAENGNMGGAILNLDRAIQKARSMNR
jgi:hypothetical protein